MNELLFENKIEKEAFENILALNQIKKCDNEIEKYTNEINNLNIEMKDILKNEDVNEEYVEKIHKYKSVLTNLEGDNGRISELDSTIADNESKIEEYQAKITQAENALESLKREIFETVDPSKVIDCQNEIETTNVKLNELNEIVNQLISENTPLLIEREYLCTKNNGMDSNIPSFNKEEIQNDLERISKVFEEEISKLALPIRENIEFCQKKIRNREIEIEKFKARKESVIESYPNSIQLDVEKAYLDINSLLNELNLIENKTVFNDMSIFEDTEESTDIETEEKTEEITEEVEESKDTENKIENIKDEMVLLEEEETSSEEEVEVPTIEEKTEEPKEEIEEPKEDITEEPEKTEEVPTEVEEETKEVEEIPVIEEQSQVEPEKTSEEENNENEEIGSVSYVLSDGESLINIAEKVYPSKDNWEAIYYFNKDAIDKYLISNGISDDFDTIKELANDTSLFTGIKLEIPTDYNYKI